MQFFGCRPVLSATVEELMLKTEKTVYCVKPFYFSILSTIYFYFIICLCYLLLRMT
jgi:hypothetical protein